VLRGESRVGKLWYVAVVVMPSTELETFYYRDGVFTAWVEEKHLQLRKK
jgi:hypothetical protein